MVGLSRVNNLGLAASRPSDPTMGVVPALRSHELPEGMKVYKVRPQIDVSHRDTACTADVAELVLSA